jgi:hypothetical protein
MSQKYISADLAAKLLHVKPSTLQVWRCTGKYNLPYIKSGGRVLYKESDLISWLESRTFTHSGQEEK